MSGEDENCVPCRDFESILKFRLDDERLSTATSREQLNTESSVEKCFDRYRLQHLNDPLMGKFRRKEHLKYLEMMLHHLPTHYECLDASRTWCVYWILQAMHLLNFSFSTETQEQVVRFLIKCRSTKGGFGGGPGQSPHLATTYASINSLAMIGTQFAYEAMRRDELITFLLSLKQDNGSFRMDADGEVDVRGAYCAVSIAKLTNFPTDIMERLFAGTGDWIASCQTYEGGFGGAPQQEAHGGYTFCAFAALALLNEANKCNLEQLLRWTVQRQMAYEGGFQGRTNKLVDGCYSFWVGAIIPIIQAIIANDPRKAITKPLFNVGALQEYILLCCQKLGIGGLIDKPGKPQDLYHTCYTLCGVSLAQHAESVHSPSILCCPSNELLTTHPLFNIPPESVSECLEYFHRRNEERTSKEQPPPPPTNGNQ